MRLACLPLLLIVAAGCHDRDSARGHEREPAPAPEAAAWVAPAGVSNGAVTAQVLWIDRAKDHVDARLRLENISGAPVVVRNLGDTLTGFRCAVEGRSYSAESRRRDQPTAAAALTELPAQTPVELDLRWRINPLRSDAYDCTLVVSNLFQDAKKLPDLSLAIPGPVRPDEHPAEPDRTPKPEKSDKPAPQAKEL